MHIVVTSQPISNYCLQQAGCSEDRVLYFENKEGGHGGAADSKQQAYMTVLYMKFLWKHLV